MAWSDVSASAIHDPIRRVAHAALVVFALLAKSAAAATIAISLVSHADTIEIEASALLNADLETTWRVLTNYEGYVDFIPGLRDSHVITRQGSTVTVAQSGDVMLGLLRAPLAVTFEITEIAPTRLVSRVVSGDLRALESCYALTGFGNGVRLEYTGKLDSGLALFAAIERLAVRQNVASRFQALADEIERQSASASDQSRIPLPEESAMPSRRWTAPSACSARED